MPAKILEQIVQVAQSVNAFVLSDEVYRGLNLTEEKKLRLLQIFMKRGISVCSMSKIFFACGIAFGMGCLKK